MTELTVEVHADPAVWLAGPRDPADAEAWVDAAERAVAEDLALPDGSDLRRYVRGVLRAFAEAPSVSPFRFVRLRSLAEPPLVARIDVESQDATSGPDGKAGDPLVAFGDDLDWYDHAPAVVDLGDGVRRAVRMYVDDGVRTVVRFHRYDTQHRVHVLLSCVGFDMMSVASGMADLHALVLAVEISAVEISAVEISAVDSAAVESGARQDA